MPSSHTIERNADGKYSHKKIRHIGRKQTLTPSIDAASLTNYAIKIQAFWRGVRVRSYQRQPVRIKVVRAVFRKEVELMKNWVSLVFYFTFVMVFMNYLVLQRNASHAQHVYAMFDEFVRGIEVPANGGICREQIRQAQIALERNCMSDRTVNYGPINSSCDDNFAASTETVTVETVNVHSLPFFMSHLLYVARGFYPRPPFGQTGMLSLTSEGFDGADVFPGADDGRPVLPVTRGGMSVDGGFDMVMDEMAQLFENVKVRYPRTMKTFTASLAVHIFDQRRSVTDLEAALEAGRPTKISSYLITLLTWVQLHEQDPNRFGNKLPILLCRSLNLQVGKCDELTREWYQNTIWANDVAWLETKMPAVNHSEHLSMHAAVNHIPQPSMHAAVAAGCNQSECLAQCAACSNGTDLCYSTHCGSDGFSDQHCSDKSGDCDICFPESKCVAQNFTWSNCSRCVLRLYFEDLWDKANLQRQSLRLTLPEGRNISIHQAKQTVLNHIRSQRSRLRFFNHIFVGALVLARRKKMLPCNTKLEQASPLCRSDEVDIEPCCHPYSPLYKPQKLWKKFCPPFHFDPMFNKHSFWMPLSFTFHDSKNFASLLPLAAISLSFIDASIDELQIAFAMHNAQLRVYSLCVVHFTLQPSGKVGHIIDCKTVEHHKLSTELLDPLRWVFYVLLSVQLVSFVVKCHAILNNLNNAIIDRQLPSSCNGGWLIDMCNITLYIVGCYLWIKHVIEMEDFELKSFHDEEINPTQSQNKSLDHLFDEIHMQQLFLVNQANAADRYFVLQGFSLLVSIVRLFRRIRFQPELAIMTAAIQKSLSDLIPFTIVFFTVSVILAAMLVMYFGTIVNEFATLGSALYTMQLWLLGEISVGKLGMAEFFEEGGLGAKLLFALFMVAVSCILMNMFLAIILNAFDEAKDDSKKEVFNTDSVLSQLARSARFGYDWKDLQTIDSWLTLQAHCNPNKQWTRLALDINLGKELGKSCKGALDRMLLLYHKELLLLKAFEPKDELHLSSLKHTSADDANHSVSTAADAPTRSAVPIEALPLFSNTKDKDKEVRIVRGMLSFNDTTLLPQWIGAVPESGYTKIDSVEDKVGGKVSLINGVKFENPALLTRSVHDLGPVAVALSDDAIQAGTFDNSHTQPAASSDTNSTMALASTTRPVALRSGSAEAGAIHKVADDGNEQLEVEAAVAGSKMNERIAAVECTVERMEHKLNHVLQMLISDGRDTRSLAGDKCHQQQTAR